jgi:hypothetical protein
MTDERLAELWEGTRALVCTNSKQCSTLLECLEEIERLREKLFDLGGNPGQ